MRWTDKYERARKAGAWIIYDEMVVGHADEKPGYGGESSAYTIVWPAGVVEGLVSALTRIEETGKYPDGHTFAGEHAYMGEHHATCVSIAAAALARIAPHGKEES